MKAEHERELSHVRTMGRLVRSLASETKNQILIECAKLLRESQDAIVAENKIDLEHLSNETTQAYRDRLLLTPNRIEAMAVSLEAVAAWPDPVGELVDHQVLPNKLKVRRVRAPLGVIFMIFESRPNVAIEAFSLGFKAGNAVILRGGSESSRTVAKLYEIIRHSARKVGLQSEVFWGIDDYDRGLVAELLTKKAEIDIVVPRGGEKLIAFVQENAAMPIIKNDRGLCHAYVHVDADLDMAAKIITNGKVQRPSVCNSLETALLNVSVFEAALKKLTPTMPQVQWFACPRSLPVLRALGAQAEPATDKNYNTEYLDYKMNCLVVDSFDDALAHIEKFGSKHSETIITHDSILARRFQNDVDAAAVYWNASTRFTDGFEFGLGGELGISTQKLHVRGPVGLRELTTPRWIIDGSGQIRE